MLGNVGLQQIIYSIGNDPSLRLPLFTSGITTLQLGRKDLVCRHLGLMKGYTAIRPDRVLAQSRAGTTGAIKNDEHLAALRGDFHAEAWTTDVPVDDVRLANRQRIDITLGHFDTWHRRKLLSGVLPSLPIGSATNETTGANVILGPH